MKDVRSYAGYDRTYGDGEMNSNLKAKFYAGEIETEELVWELDRINPDANIRNRYLIDGEEVESLLASVC